MKLPHPNLLLKNFAFTALLLIAAVALFSFAARYPLQLDITQNTRNSLQPASIEVLNQLHGPLTFSVFSTEQDAKQGDIRKLIRGFVSLYQRYKPDIVLKFIDPATHPDEVRRDDIQANGEMVIEYDGRIEHLTMYSEQALTSALLSLAHRKDQLVMYVSGHGERKLDGIANYDLGQFGKRLNQLGFRIAGLNLAIAPDVPTNASLLVITQPQVDWLPGEVDKLMRFVNHGGNLLWLLDAEPMHGLEPLAEKLGLALTPGVVIDPDAEQMRAPPTWTLGANYPPHAITRNFNLPTAFPYARALGREENRIWQYSTLVDAAPNGWVSENIPRENSRPRFNKNRDTPGPVAVALALQRDVDGLSQRIVVVGSGSFLANTYAGNGGNLDLGVNMVNWLSNQEKLITIPPRASRDDTVTLSTTQKHFIIFSLVIVLPILLALVGGLLWWRRRQ